MGERVAAPYPLHARQRARLAWIGVEHLFEGHERAAPIIVALVAQLAEPDEQVGLLGGIGAGGDPALEHIEQAVPARGAQVQPVERDQGFGRIVAFGCRHVGVDRARVVAQLFLADARELAIQVRRQLTVGGDPGLLREHVGQAPKAAQLARQPLEVGEHGFVTGIGGERAAQRVEGVGRPPAADLVQLGQALQLGA